MRFARKWLRQSEGRGLVILAVLGLVWLEIACHGCGDPRLREAENLYDSAEKKYEEGRLDEAVRDMEASLASAREVLDPDDPSLALAQFDLGGYYLSAGREDEAVEVLLTAHAVLSASTEADPHALAAVENLLGRTYAMQGRYAEAEPLLEHALEIASRESGGDELGHGLVLYDLSIVYLGQGELEQGEAALRRSLEILETVLGPADPLLVDPLHDLGMVEYGKGRAAEAVPLFQRALEIAVRDSDPAAEAGISVGLARAYGALGERERAAALYATALPFLEANDLLGPADEAADLYLGAALSAHFAGHGREAIGWYTRFLAIAEESRGPDLGDDADVLGYLAGLYVDLGEYARADAHFERWIDLLERAEGPASLDLALALKSRADLHHARGDMAAMVGDLERALAIYEAAGDAERAATAAVLNNLGTAHMEMGQLAEASPLLWRSLEMERTLVGSDSPAYAVTLNNIGFSLWKLGDLEAAEEMWSEAHGIQVATLEPTDEAHVVTLTNLATAARERGDFDRATGLLAQALEIQRQHDGDNAARLAEIHSGTFFVHLDQGHLEEALEFHRRVNEIQDREIERILAVGSERQRRAGVDRLAPGTYSTLTFQLTRLPDHEAAAEFALTTVLRRKAKVLDAQSDTYRTVRNSLDSEGRILLEELMELRAAKATEALGTTADGGPPPGSSRDDRIEALEQALATRSGTFRAEAALVTLDEVRGRLPEDSVLIEFMAYMPMLSARAGTYGESVPPRYAAYVLHPDGRIHSVDLGDLVAIDSVVMALRQVIVGGADVEDAARASHDALMAPLLPYIGEAEHLLVSPDGQLALVPFGALMGADGRFLLETHRLTYLTSGRDLLRLDTGAIPEDGPVLVADPAFEGRDGGAAVPTPGDAIAGLRSARLDGLVWERLRGSAEEVERIHEMLPGARRLTDGKATETALKELDSPLVLHAATHGFFLEDLGAPLPGGTRGAKRVLAPTEESVLGPYMLQTGDPMLRSGLVLAGANVDPVGLDDGYLTAFELSTLDLVGTRLVVLSACDTGVGEVRHGAGVHGLQRALVLAGAESVIMSLWKVDDDATADLMTVLYRGLLEGKGRGDALRDARLEMLRTPERAHPRFWAAFVAAGDWRPLKELTESTRQ